MIPLVLGSSSGSRTGHRRHRVDRCLWAAVKTRSVIQGHCGEGIVWISLLAQGMAGLTWSRWSFRVQIKRETA